MLKTLFLEILNNKILVVEPLFEKCAFNNMLLNTWHRELENLLVPRTTIKSQRHKG